VRSIAPVAQRRPPEHHDFALRRGGVKLIGFEFLRRSDVHHATGYRIHPVLDVLTSPHTPQRSSFHGKLGTGAGFLQAANPVTPKIYLYQEKILHAVPVKIVAQVEMAT